MHRLHRRSSRGSLSTVAISYVENAGGNGRRWAGEKKSPWWSLMIRPRGSLQKFEVGQNPELTSDLFLFWPRRNIITTNGDAGRDYGGGQWKWTWTWHTHGMQMESPDKRRSLQFASRFARNSTSRPERTFTLLVRAPAPKCPPSGVLPRPWISLEDGRLERMRVDLSIDGY